MEQMLTRAGWLVSDHHQVFKLGVKINLDQDQIQMT